MIKTAFIAAAFLGLTGVILGAMGAHALEKVLSPDQLDSFETAVRFQMYHAFMLMGLGLFALKYPSRLIHYAVFSAIIGVVLFSGSIYLLVLSSVPVGIVTPIGGVFLIISWTLLLISAINLKPQE